MDVATLIADTARRWGVDPGLAVAVARQESGLQQFARGAAGEVGVMQLMPATARGLGVDPYDLQQNIEGGVRYLRQMLDRYGDTATALAAYNAGPGNVDRGTVPRSSWAYASAILSRIGAAFTGSPSSEPPGASSTWPELPSIEDPDSVMLPAVAAVGALALALYVAL